MRKEIWAFPYLSLVFRVILLLLPFHLLEREWKKSREIIYTDHLLLLYHVRARLSWTWLAYTNVLTDSSTDVQFIVSIHALQVTRLQFASAIGSVIWKFYSNKYLDLLELSEYSKAMLFGLYFCSASSLKPADSIGFAISCKHWLNSDWSHWSCHVISQRLIPLIISRDLEANSWRPMLWPWNKFLKLVLDSEWCRWLEVFCLINCLLVAMVIISSRMSHSDV